MGERNIAAEVLEALREVQEHRAGKRTLRTMWVPVAFAKAIARRQQGRSKLPPSATALILMARKYPDTFERLASL